MDYLLNNIDEVKDWLRNVNEEVKVLSLRCSL